MNLLQKLSVITLLASSPLFALPAEQPIKKKYDIEKIRKELGSIPDEQRTQKQNDLYDLLSHGLNLYKGWLGETLTLANEVYLALGCHTIDLDFMTYLIETLEKDSDGVIRKESWPTNDRLMKRHKDAIGILNKKTNCESCAFFRDVLNAQTTIKSEKVQKRVDELLKGTTK
jgi:hypothetical protein